MRDGWLNRSSGRSTGQGRPSALRAEACSQKQSPAPAGHRALPSPPRQDPASLPRCRPTGRSRPEAFLRAGDSFVHVGMSYTVIPEPSTKGPRAEGEAQKALVTPQPLCLLFTPHAEPAPRPWGPGPECSPAVPVKAVLTPGSGVRPVLHIPLARPLCPAWMRGGPPASQQPHGLCGRGAWN